MGDDGRSGRRGGQQYFEARPTAVSAPRSVRMELPERELPVLLRSDAAVFSGRAVDPGTALLLSDGARPDPDEPATLVDVGCGYGPLTVALALRAPTATIWAVEVNERARHLCRANVEAVGAGDRVRVVSPEEVPVDLVVDGIWSNPPVRIGKSALHDLLRLWVAHLRVGRQAHLVVARNLGADSLAEWMRDQGWTVERRASRRGYRLLDVHVEQPAEGSGTP